MLEIPLCFSWGWTRSVPLHSGIQQGPGTTYHYAERKFYRISRKATPERGRIFGDSEDGRRSDCHEQAWPLARGERLKQINFVVCKIYTNKTEKVTKERRKREKERERGKDGRPSSPETPLSLPCSAQKSKPKPIGWRVVEAAEGELRRGHPK